MANKKSDNGKKADRELREQSQKAVRRGEKLMRTLTRIVAQVAPDVGHPAHILLLALRKGLPKLRDHGEADTHSIGSPKTKKVKAVEPKATTTAARKASPRAKAARSSGARHVKRPPIDLKTDENPAA